VSRGFIEGEYQDGELRGLGLLVGMANMGKSTEMDRLLQQCGGGVIFFDRLSKHGHFQGYTIITDPAQLLAYLRPNRGRRFRVMYQPRAGNLDMHFRSVSRIVKAMGWMIFAVDEIDSFCGARFGDYRMPPELYDLVNYRRHYRVSMLATARRPQTVAPGYRDEAEWRVFRLKNDVAERIKGDIGEDNARRVVNLPRFQYLRFMPDADPVLCGGAR